MSYKQQRGKKELELKLKSQQASMYISSMCGMQNHFAKEKKERKSLLQNKNGREKKPLVVQRTEKGKRRLTSIFNG